MNKISLSSLFILCTLALASQPQYLMPQFESGTVYYKEGAVVKAHMNYNLLAGRIMISESGKLKALHLTEDIEYLGIGKTQFIPLDNDFGQIIFDGEKAVLAVKIRGTVKTAAGAKSISRDKLDKQLEANGPMPEGISIATDSTYWLVRQKEYTKRFHLAESRVEPANRRGFVKMYAKFAKEIDDYVLEHEINFNLETDLRKLITYCESIQ